MKGKEGEPGDIMSSVHNNVPDSIRNTPEHAAGMAADTRNKRKAYAALSMETIHFRWIVMHMLLRCMKTDCLF